MEFRRAWCLLLVVAETMALLSACSATEDDSAREAAADAAADDAASVDSSAETSDAGFDSTDADAARSHDASESSAEASTVGDASSDDGDANGDGGPLDPLAFLRLEGRWSYDDPTVPRTAYPGARIAFAFQGTGVALRLSERPSDRSSFGTSQFSVTIDGQPAPSLVTTIAGTVEETHDYTLAEGLPAGLHAVQLSRRTEAEFGSTGLVDVLVTGGGLVAPPPARVHRLEIVGDSNTTGYGIEATRPCVHTASHENWDKAFPALLATRFDAEVQTVSYSGKGVRYNVSPSDPLNLTVLYDRSIPSEPGSVYDASSFPAEAVVVLAGGVDFTNRRPVEFFFEADYDALIEKIHLAHPDATVFCTVSPGIYDAQDWLTRTVVREALQKVVSKRSAAGQKIVFHEFPQGTDAELNACDYHSNPAHHAALASSLGALMSTTLGWP